MPIAISSHLTPQTLSHIEFSYASADICVENINYAIELTICPGTTSTGSSIKWNNDTYNLVQFHFHSPAEHTGPGVTGVMEVHFVHQDTSTPCKTLVIAVLAEIGDNTNDAMHTILTHLPPSPSSRPRVRPYLES